MLGGQDPLDGISAYKAETPSPHWHFVTYGFSELYDKESEDADVSGYGFELTFRLARSEEEEEPPARALNLLQNMGRYVFNSGNLFRAGGVAIQIVKTEIKDQEGNVVQVIG